MESFDGQNFALCGKTIQSLRRNVIGQLKTMLLSRGYAVEEHRSENLIVIRKGKSENTFYLFGGKDEGSQDLIQGITLAGVFFDEVALMPEFCQSGDRTMLCRGIKVLVQLQPGRTGSLYQAGMD